MAYRDLKDLTKRTSSDKIVRDKAFNIPKNPKYDGYQRGVVLIVNKFFWKETSVNGIKKYNTSNKELAEGYTNQLLENLKKKSTLTFYRFGVLILLICN